MAECVICGRKTSGSLEFCQNDYKQHREEIKEKRPWVRVLKNDAQRERRRRDREFGDQSLEAIQERYDERRWE